MKLNVWMCNCAFMYVYYMKIVFLTNVTQAFSTLSSGVIDFVTIIITVTFKNITFSILIIFSISRNFSMTFINNMNDLTFFRKLLNYGKFCNSLKSEIRRSRLTFMPSNLFWFFLTLSWQRPLSYRNHSIDLLRKKG